MVTMSNTMFEAPWLPEGIPMPTEQDLNFEAWLDKYPRYKHLLNVADPMDLYETIQGWWSDLDDKTSEFWTTGQTDDTITKLEEAILGSEWAKTYEPIARSALLLEAQDPAAFRASFTEKKDEIKEAARDMQLALTDQEIDEYTRDAVLGGWATEDIEEELANKKYDPTFKPTAGSIFTLAKQLEGYAGNQLVSDTAFNPWRMAWDIKAGKTNLELAQQRINSIAANDWGVDDFDIAEEYALNGTTLSDRLSGVKRTIGQYWDLGDNEIDLMDIGAENLIITGEDGKRRFMTSKEAKLYARQDERFLNSDIYKREVGAIGTGLSRMFQ